ncbi:WD domain-containing protein [Schizothecium vesticola]|uniref:Elongator complex protein 2 n=1 Tax=Schizothecium vesticola TaxID=314040 RepID=A0AA40FBJ1_9PEZI|nr:WD domain-containing protein [Schizothecium vesticola]
MAEAVVISRYLSAGANRYSAAADWGDEGTVAFGSDSNVCFWNPANTRGITHIISGHTAHVRSVKFLPKLTGDEVSFLVTGGDDLTLRIWASDPESGAVTCLQTLEGHTSPINCIAALRAPQTADDKRRIFASGAADATVKVWSFEAGGQAMLLQTIKTAKGYLPLAIALSPLDDDGKALIMAVAGTTSTVQIFTAAVRPENSTELEFSLQATLSGHENWVRSLDFIREKPDEAGSDLLLASASQDKYIRIWRVHQGTALSALSAVGVDMAVGALMPGNKIHKLSAAGQKYCVMFEALLLGHEDWIYSAKWTRAASPDSRLQLLSASADNSLSIWESDADSGIWITVARLGELSREKGATTATGSIGGFWTGLWSPTASTVVTLGRTGSWRRWDHDPATDAWHQALAISGHTRAVTGLSWARDGSHLLSTSSDQTTRLHAEWTATGTWHELARPQIHGYDLNCIDTLGPSSFVSGADEKLLRVFTTPQSVARLLARLTPVPLPPDASTLPDAANMPVLGLSNKAIDSAPLNDENLLPQQHPTSALEASHPPFEDSLSRHTLFPETEKLYGHGYEISCLAATADGALVASACRASSLNHAVVRLVETRRWTEVKPPLAAHALTVTRLRFGGEGDRFLLSVGRDRQWVVWEREEGGGFKLLQANAKGHSRMILDAAWGGGGGRVFATAGRDRQVKVWVRRGEGGEFVLGLAVAQEHAVTALDFAAEEGDGRMVLAVGTEAGKLAVLVLRVEGEGEVVIVETVEVPRELWLPRAVMQLAWRPARGEDGKGRRELAVAGEDGSLRIYAVAV